MTSTLSTGQPGNAERLRSRPQCSCGLPYTINIPEAGIHAALEMLADGRTSSKLNAQLLADVHPKSKAHNVHDQNPGRTNNALEEISDVLSKVCQMNNKLVLAAWFGSLGGLVFGYDLGALSSSTQSLHDYFLLSPAAFGLTISASLWGTICGSLLAGWRGDVVSRRDLITASAALYAVASIMVTFASLSAWPLVLAMRFLCGMAIGGFTVGCPLYLSELAPNALRGRLVSLFQIQIGIGVVIAFSVGSLFSHLSTQGNLWKDCMGLGAVPATCLLILRRLMPEMETPVNPSKEKERTHAPSVPHQVLNYGRLFRRENARPILLATSIAVFNQLSGVNVLLLYLLEILASAGIGLTLGHTYTVLIAWLSLATTLLGMMFVDKLGRKPLLVLGSAGMALCLVSLGLTIPHHFAAIVTLAILVAYNVFFAFSQGTVVWVYLSELFPPGLRGVGQGYGSSIHWIANAILISVFPLTQHLASVRIFYFFAGMMVLQIAVVLLWYPETRGTALGSAATVRTRDE